MGAKRTAERIEATGWGSLFDQDMSLKTGQYQIQCKLVYFQEEEE
jgi:hypothetical protein